MPRKQQRHFLFLFPLSWRDMQSMLPCWGGGRRKKNHQKGNKSAWEKGSGLCVAGQESVPFGAGLCIVCVISLSNISPG